MKLRVIDFETDGMPPDARICEVGYCDLRTYDADPAEVGDPVGMLVNPGRPMPPEARAIHHIGDADLLDAPPVTTGFLVLTNGNPDVFVAHNAAFERAFFTGGDTPWLCTLKVGRRIWPEAPSHGNQCLRYYLGLDDCDPHFDSALAMPVHRAAPDAYVTAFLLREAIKHATIEQMIEWSNQPSLLPRVTFGKHRGQEWSALPPDYLSWLVNKSDMDEDTKFTAKYWLNRRRSDDR